MSKRMGVWIDHRKAVIVTVTPAGETAEEIDSGVEKQLGRIDGVRSTTPYESQLVPADDNQERKLKAHYNAFYDGVIGRIRHADAILILGPGEAKGELSRRLKKDAPAAAIVGIETTDKLTDRQVMALVRDHFAEAQQ
jgi:hypothetical protein